MKIYPYLRLLWIALAGSALLNLTALSDFMPLLLVANVLNLACFGLIAYVLYRLSDESVLFSRAFPARLFSVALIGLALVCTRFAPENQVLLNFLSLLSLAGSVASLLSDYYMYWGLDERVISSTSSIVVTPLRAHSWAMASAFSNEKRTPSTSMQWRMSMSTTSWGSCSVSIQS